MKFLLTILICFYGYASFSQSKRIDSILISPEVKLPYYEMEESGSKVMYLPMSYGKSVFSVNQAAVIAKLQRADIRGIDLVYSDHPHNGDFKALNKKRLESLQKILPDVFGNSRISFRKVRQTGAATREDASYLAHGFYIYYRPLPDEVSGKKEAAKIKADLGEKVSKDTGLYANACQIWSVVMDTADIGWPLQKNFTRSITKMTLKQALKDSLIQKEYYDLYEGYDTVYYVLDINDDGCGDIYNYQSTDSTVSRVLNRHKWSKAMIIADVTGSMYPYTTQLLLWLKLTLTDKKPRQFVFFNDGDMKRDEEKITGKTGGIYKTVTASYDEVEKTIVTAMERGSGGDAPENNVEALLSAEKDCVSCDSIVMIADNWAPVKDMSLLPLFKKPVKVIVCGVYGPVNADYINIARKTGGSLHLIEQDIYDLSKMKEGDILEIKGTKYKLTDGEFKEVLDRKI